ncbi:MAG: polysaccharide biosynthesis/export family protein [Bernardetiaceae bacterium]|nr:polysaccharide biosynthesis/export family protein [Bernardetiaceae bacterium]
MIKQSKFTVFCSLLLVLLLSACGAYKQDLLFRTGEEFNNQAFQAYLADAEQNYRVAKFDNLTIEIFTDSGEVLSYPREPIIQQEAEMGTGGGGGGRGVSDVRFDPPDAMLFGQTMGGGGMFLRPLRRYFVNENGQVRLPLLDFVDVEGMALYEIEDMLAKRYSEFYDNPYVITRYTNKRVIMMGALGNRIITMREENLNLLEAIALTGEITPEARMSRVCIIRGMPEGKPIMQEINLSTYEGLRAAELILRPNDVIYIEPRRRLGREFMADLRDFAAVIGSTTSLVLTTFLVVDRLSRDD